ncbi:hypothetical protein BH09ACT6_BH09ACT6_10150 [soil metagenome]
MPKISAPTVVEHRSRQRAALLLAATGILVEGGVSAVTPAAVSTAAGLARPSFYQYFSSGADVVAAIIEDAFPRANRILAESLATVGTPDQRIDAYIRETLRLAAEGYHKPASALAGAVLPTECRARLVELHREQVAPFIEALADFGVPELPLTSRLLGGMIEAAMVMVEAGESLEAVTQTTTSLVRSAISAMRQPTLPSSGRADGQAHAPA